jgi:hypothetical protein
MFYKEDYIKDIKNEMHRDRTCGPLLKREVLYRLS